MSKNVNDMNEFEYVLHLLTQREPLMVLIGIILFLVAIAVFA